MKQEPIRRPSAWGTLAMRDDAALLLLALALIAPLFFIVPVTHDEIWDLWIGREMVHGARLYRDIIEVNPPLWFWISAALATTGLELRALAAAFFLAATALSLWLTPPRYRLLAMAAILVLPLHDFGQREDFTLIACVPYVFLIAARANGEPPRYPIVSGLLAALGLALKPYFVIVPIVLELMVKKRIRPENVTLAICAVAYAIAVPLITPEYLTSVVPMLRQAYGAFGGGVGNLWTLIAFAFAAIGIALGRRKGDATTRTLFVAALAFLPSALIQAKGWPYQSVPARGFLFMAIALELTRIQKRPVADGLMVGAALVCFFPLGWYTNDYQPEVERHLAGVPKGASIAVIANNPSLAWPMVYDHRLKWVMPEMSAWQIQAMSENPAVKPIAQRYVDAALARHPDILVIDIRPDFAAATASLIPAGYLSGYRMRLRTKRLQSYARKGFTPQETP